MFRGAFLFFFFALLCFIQSVRELIGRTKKASRESDSDSSSESLENEYFHVLSGSPPLVPREEAEALVRAIAQKHGAKGVLRSLGNLPQKQVANAVAHFAQQMEDDETPLILLDASFLNNGKAGLLLTNRGLYSSFCSHPIWLADIEEVSYTKPGLGDYILLHLFGGLGHIILFGLRSLQNRLRVNGKTVYSTGNPLRSAFWFELLTELAEAARQVQLVEEEEAPKPSIVVLETALRIREDESLTMRQLRNPSWHDIERSIRALDQSSYPALRIWAGEVEQAPALEILGGNGKYVLRELGDGWVYYDPGGSEQEVEVCVGPLGCRAPAFYVCTDLQRVLEIARRYAETGTPE
jgi:hypothetical protein